MAVPTSQPAKPAEQATPHRPVIIHTGRGFKVEIAGDFHPMVLEKGSARRAHHQHVKRIEGIARAWGLDISIWREFSSL